MDEYALGEDGDESYGVLPLTSGTRGCPLPRAPCFWSGSYASRGDPRLYPSLLSDG